MMSAQLPEAQFEFIRGSLEQVDKRMSFFERALLSLREELESRFSSIDKRFEQMDARFVQMDARFVQMDARFVQMDSHFGRVDAHFGRVEERLDRIDARFEVIVESIGLWARWTVGTVFVVGGTMIAAVILRAH